MSSIRVVKLQARKVKYYRREEGKLEKTEETMHYLLTIPREFIEKLGWTKGDPLIVRIMEITINGSKKKALVYYKP